MHLRALPLLLVALAACRPADDAPATANPPAAEFILAAGDSSYWVRSDTTGVHIRGAPIELAQLDGRFVEVYVVDDDHSFENADLVGQSVYRRDLRTGDSVRVFTDSMVPALAREYAAAHPHERRLSPDDEGSDEPDIRATATLEFAGTHGPFVSYSLHTDIERGNAPLWHTTRAGVLDLRTGKPARLADIVGTAAGAIEKQRDEMLRVILDSARSRDAARATRYRLDASSFTVTTLRGAPAIAYALPTAGVGDDEETIALPVISFAEPSWWRDLASSLPESSGDGTTDRWEHGGLSVIARYDSRGDGRVLLRAGTHDWPVGTISSPASRIYWLDRQSVDTATRHALVRAFDEAAAYGSDAHIASRNPSSLLKLTSNRQ